MAGPWRRDGGFAPVGDYMPEANDMSYSAPEDGAAKGEDGVRTTRNRQGATRRGRRGGARRRCRAPGGAACSCRAVDGVDGGAETCTCNGGCAAGASGADVAGDDSFDVVDPRSEYPTDDLIGTEEYGQHNQAPQVAAPPGLAPPPGLAAPSKGQRASSRRAPAGSDRRRCDRLVSEESTGVGSCTDEDGPTRTVGGWEGSTGEEDLALSGQAQGSADRDDQDWHAKFLSAMEIVASCPEGEDPTVRRRWRHRLESSWLPDEEGTRILRMMAELCAQNY